MPAALGKSQSKATTGNEPNSLGQEIMGVAVEELSAYLRNGLARALGSRDGVRDNDLDDFTQEALVQILRKLDTFRGESRFTTWAMAIAIRVAFTALRKRRYRDRSIDELEQGVISASSKDPRHVIDPQRALIRKDIFGALHHAVDHSLTERQRAVILGELDGVPTAVLAESLGTNRNALYKLHHDARKKLLHTLTELGFTESDIRQELLQE